MKRDGGWQLEVKMGYMHVLEKRQLRKSQIILVSKNGQVNGRVVPSRADVRQVRLPSQDGTYGGYCFLP